MPIPFRAEWCWQYFVLLHIIVTENSIVLKGMWKTRLVKIDRNSITKVEKTFYSSYHLNNPAFNVHSRNTIKFYAGGKDAIRVTDREGMDYLIGTHKPEEFFRSLSAN